MKWLDGWNDRILLAIDHTQFSQPVYNLPVLLILDDTMIDFTKLKSDASDIRLVPANHSKIYPYEFEIVDMTNKVIKLWFLIDCISPTQPEFFFLYYSNPNATDAQDPSALWQGANAILVMHFPQGDLFKDSTGLNTISSNTGSTTFLAEGPVGTCWQVDTDSEAIFPYIDSYGNIHRWTFETYAYQRTTSVYWNGIMGTRFGSDYTFDVKIKNDSNSNVHKARIDVGDGSQWIHYEDYGNNIGVEWFQMGFVVDSTSMLYIQDGNVTDTYSYSNMTPLFMKSNQTLHVARSRPATEYGRYNFEELRVYSEPKSKYFLQASYKSILNQIVIYDQTQVQNIIPKHTRMLGFNL